MKGKINISALPGAHQIEHPQHGKCTIIVHKEAKVFEGKSGNYIDIVTFAKKDRKGEFIIKQSLTKDEIEEMKRQGKQQPIIGDLTDFDLQKAPSNQKDDFVW